MSRAFCNANEGAVVRAALASLSPIVQRGSDRACGSDAIRMFGSHTFELDPPAAMALPNGTSANVTNRKAGSA